jgi:cell division initiation protein
MKVTALEIRQREFALRFRGYDPAEVDTFLELVAGQIEDLLKDNVGLREALARQEEDIQRIRQGEGDWKKALMTAQQITEELIGRAQRRAQAVLAAAEREAHQMLLEAENGRQTLDHDVQVLRRQRRQLVGQLRGFLERHLEFLEAQDKESGEQQADDGSKALCEASEAPNGSDEGAFVEREYDSDKRCRRAALGQDRPA